MAQPQPIRSKPKADDSNVVIPDKLYFRIGDVARLCDLPAYVLRFWETEFPQLKPHKGGTGQRLYRKRDVESVLEIKHLLYAEGFTIAGARRWLAERRKTSERQSENQPEIPNSQTALQLSGQSEGQDQVATQARNDSSYQPRHGKRENGLPSSAPGDRVPSLDRLRVEMRELLDLLNTDQVQRRSETVRSRRAGKREDFRKGAPGLFEN